MYSVIITMSSGDTISVPCTTEDEAFEVRDDAFMAGHAARIEGLGFTGWACAPGYPRLLEISDN